MRIAMLVAHTCPFERLGSEQAGGLNVYVRELSAALAEAGHAVDIYVGVAGDNPARPQDTGLIRSFVTTSAPEVALSPDARLAAFTEGVRNMMARNGETYDLLHGHYWLGAATGRLLQADGVCGALVCTFHTLGARGRPRTPPLRLGWEGRLCREADAVTFSGSAEATMLMRAGVDIDRLHRVTPGTPVRNDAASSPSALAGAASDSPFRLLLVGRLVEEKGLDLLLRALSDMNRDEGRRKTVLTVIGGSARERRRGWGAAMCELAANLGVASAVVWRGQVEPEGVARAMTEADVLAAPSRYETFGLAVAEALSCGLPVVATRTGGLADQVEHGVTGMLTPAEDISGLTNALRILRDDPDRLARLGQAARSRRSHTWLEAAAEAVDAYQAAATRLAAAA